MKTKLILNTLSLALICVLIRSGSAQSPAPSTKPNILAIWGDDIGIANVSAYVWKKEFTNLRAPNIYNLRADPFERGPESFAYGQWMMDLGLPDRAVAGGGREMAGQFQGIPSSAKPASFNLDEVMRKLSEKQGAND